MSKDFYNTLGVSKTASQDEIKSAYRKLVMKHHPDRNQGDTSSLEKFKEIQKAYSVLSDPDKRSNYDRFGEEGANFSSFSSSSGFESAFGDFFEDIFGGGSRSEKQNYRGADLNHSITINLEDASKGIENNITYKSTSKCTSCDGTGSKNKAAPKTCDLCNGHGIVIKRQGPFTVQQTCHKCYGSGSIIDNPCNKCRGSGLEQRTKTIAIKIPAGIKDGDTIKLKGEGEAGAMGATSGDLYVQIRIRKHKIFIRKGNDLYCEIPIGIVTAILGGEVDIPTISSGVARLKIFPETQNDKVYKLSGKGMPILRSSYKGDMYCHIYVEVPVNLNAEQKDKIKEFAALSPNVEKNHPKTKSWLNYIKSFFTEN